MSILIALIIGLAIGAAGQYFLQKEPDTLLMTVIFGVAGSIFGLVTYILMDFDTATNQLFSVPSILLSVLGSLLGVFIFSGAHLFMEKHTQSHVELGDAGTESKTEKNPGQTKDERDS